MFTATDLCSISSRVIFCRVSPDEYRQRTIAFGIVSFRKIEIAGKVNTICSFISYFLFGHSFHLWIWIGERSKLTVGHTQLQVLQPVIRHFLFTFLTGDQGQLIRIEYTNDCFIIPFLATPKRISFFSVYIVRKKEGKITFG